jgi:protein SCO1/2
MTEARQKFTQSKIAVAAFAFALSVAGASPALGHDGTKHEETETKAAAKANTEVKVRLADVELIDRERRKVRFVPEVLSDKIVVIDFIYTTCTTICPITSSIFAQVQDMLGKRLAEDIRLISLSIDPLRDTPGRMKNAAEKFGAGPGWLWLTGEKPKVDRLLKGLGAYTPDVESHPPMILVGDADKGSWVRLYGFASPDEILAQIDALEAARTRVQSSMNPGG